MTKKIFWILFATWAICFGLYPTLYFFLDSTFGLLSTKEPELYNNVYWNLSFYIHIILGGLSLLIGWTQFSKKFRDKRLNLHRQIGKLYVISSLLSGLSSIYIALYATSGLVASVGFISLGILWLYTTLAAYIHIKQGRTIDHEKMMVYSYALCFAAVMLRIWLPLLVMALNDFLIAYKMVAWLSWIPNLFFAYVWVRRIDNRDAVNLL